MNDTDQSAYLSVYPQDALSPIPEDGVSWRRGLLFQMSSSMIKSVTRSKGPGNAGGLNLQLQAQPTAATSQAMQEVFPTDIATAGSSSVPYVDDRTEGE